MFDIIGIYNSLKYWYWKSNEKSRNVKKLLYLLRYVPNQYNTQQMCDKVILGNGGTLKSAPDYFKNQCIIIQLITTLMH